VAPKVGKSQEAIKSSVKREKIELDGDRGGVPKPIISRTSRDKVRCFVDKIARAIPRSTDGIDHGDSDRIDWRSTLILNHGSQIVL
jgi:hypothetical protein